MQGDVFGCYLYVIGDGYLGNCNGYDMRAGWCFRMKALYLERAERAKKSTRGVNCARIGKEHYNSIKEPRSVRL